MFSSKNMQIISYCYCKIKLKYYICIEEIKLRFDILTLTLNN